MPDCSFEELIPIFSTRYSGDHLWLRPAMKRCGISRLGSQITPGEFTTHDTASSQSSHCNHLSNPSFMYCRTYVNLYDAVRSVIPCDKSHKHQFSFNNDGQQRASFGWDREFQYGGNFSVSWDRKGPSYSQDQDQDPGPDFGHHWRRIKMLKVAKNIKISNWHNIVYIYQFLTRNLNIYYFFLTAWIRLLFGATTRQLRTQDQPRTMVSGH